MKLQEILESQARFCYRSGITVKINHSMGWVDIRAGQVGELFLQGDDAEKFIDKVADLSRQCPDVTIADIELACAYDYAHILAEM